MPSDCKKIVVLGANSFSGQDLVDLLLDEPDCEVIGISRSAMRSEVFLRHLRRTDPVSYRYYPLDFNSQMPDILTLLDQERPQWIVNFAAQSEVAPSWEFPEQWFETNCVALARLVNHLRKCDYLERFLQISSPEVYGHCTGTVDENFGLNPSTPYAASKVAADLLLQTYNRQFGFPVLSVRATNVYGPGQQLHKILPRSVIYIRMGQKILLHGGGRAVKSFIHIRDVSRGELAVLKHGTVGQLYHLSPRRGIAVRDAVRTICEIMGCQFDEVTEEVDERPGQDAVYVIDSHRARQTLGWQPDIPFDEGLREVVAWVERYWQEIRRMPLEYQHRK